MVGDAFLNFLVRKAQVGTLHDTVLCSKDLCCLILMNAIGSHVSPRPQPLFVIDGPGLCRLTSADDLFKVAAVF